MKKYSSYSEIDFDLQVLKLEKELHYRKLTLGIEKTKDSMKPSFLTGSLLQALQSNVTGTAAFIVKLILPGIIAWLQKRRRGS